ncbi:hypothetical protein BHE74_00051892 [Ensete ventricosum]|nr:hypothetical protein BHE74_00051892 [Ensete ventricosum]
MNSGIILVGSTEDYWKRQDAAQAVALLLWEGLGLEGGPSVGNWGRNHEDCECCGTTVCHTNIMHMH